MIPRAIKYARRDFEALPRETIRTFQLARFNELWPFTVRTVPYYRDLARRLNLPDHFASLEAMSGRIPLLEKISIRNDPKQFLSEKRENGFWGVTGGSVGIPTPCYWSHRGHLETLWDRDFLLETWGIGVWDRSAFIDGHRQALEHTWKSRLSKLKQSANDRLRLRLSSFFMDDARLKRYYEQIRRAGASYLYSYSTAAFLMAKAVTGQPPIETLKLVVAYSEPLPDHCRETIGRVLQVPVATEYSAIELSPIAGTHGDGRVRIAEYGLIFETEPTPDGRHEIILTDLRNPSFPFIRYRIRDALAAPPEHGRAGCAWIGPVEGRMVDVLRTRSGRFFHGNAFIVILKEFEFIKLFQVVQESLDEITVNIQSDIGPDDERLKEPARQLTAVSGGELAVRIKVVPRIDVTAAGKHRLIINRMPPESGSAD